MEYVRFKNGTVVKVELTFRKLYRLKSINNELYLKMNKLILNGAKEIFDLTDILYGAYVTANINKYASLLDYEQFLDQLDISIEESSKIVEAMISPKKKQVSASVQDKNKKKNKNTEI